MEKCYQRSAAGFSTGQMFLFFANDMLTEVNSYISMFADDAKISRNIETIGSCRQLQCNLDKLHEWSQNWKMDFNARKCHVLEIGTSDR